MKVVGLTGQLGAGKSTALSIIQKHTNCYTITLSDIIKAEAQRRKGTLDRATLQNMGNELRRQYGPHILAMLAVEYLPKEKDLIIIDGIRNPAEAEYLRKRYGENFKLIAITASEKVRFERLLKKEEKKCPKTWEEFLEMDKRDRGEGEPLYGQQTEKCIQMADFSIINEGTVEELENQLVNILKTIL